MMAVLLAAHRLEQLGAVMASMPWSFITPKARLGARAVMALTHSSRMRSVLTFA